jgi:hypothetical protein
MAQRFESWCAGALSLLMAVCGLLLLVAGARAQSTNLAQVTNATAEDALHELAQQADVIFAGQVTAVRRHDGYGATGIVEIDFSVEDAVRGTLGGEYTLREWGGLWTAGETPLRTGQRYLMLLHAPGASGLSSPVGGEDGAIPVRGSGSPAGPETIDTASGQLASRTIDLRWIATRIERPLQYVRVPARGPIPRPVGPSPMHLASPALEPSSPIALAAEIVSQYADYATVLDKLHVWERNDRGAH